MHSPDTGKRTPIVGPRVLILGGGYVAVAITKALRGPVKRGQLDVTVVSRHNYEEFHGFVGEMVTGRVGVDQILSPLRRVCAPSRTHVGEVEAIDLVNRRVLVSRQLDGAQHELTCDELVLCLGNTDNLTMYPGLAEHAFRVKSYDDCFRIKNHILTMFELADVESDQEERRRLLTFFIAGGGFAGSEVAGELSDFVRMLTQREYNNILRDECRVVMVQPGEHILPELQTGPGAAGYGKGHPRLVEYAHRHLKQLGVEVLLNTSVAWVTATEVGLTDGSRIPTRTVISAVGSRPQPILESLPIERDAHGRIMVDAFMRVRGYQNVWAAGDCAAVPHPDGGVCPGSGLWAIKGGTHIARNLNHVLVENVEPEVFRFRGIGQVVSIGRRTAVGEFKGIEVKGRIAWLVWRAILLSLVPGWDRRVRLLSDWLVWPLVGRDVVEMNVTDAHRYDISEQHFEPGEVIVTEGRPCPFLYVVVEGQAVSSRQTLDGSKEERTLGSGDYFGRRVRGGNAEATVVAKTVLRAVAVRIAQGERLDLLSSLARAAQAAEQEMTQPDAVLR